MTRARRKASSETPTALSNTRSFFFALVLSLGSSGAPAPGWISSVFGLRSANPRERTTPTAFAAPAAALIGTWRSSLGRVRDRQAATLAMAHATRAGGVAQAEAGNVYPMSGADRDAMHMRRALELASRGVGRTRPNPAVGCVILDEEGVVVGEGFHPRAGEPHAEVWAIREAGQRARGGTAYVTLEPCNHYGRTPPCTNALIENGIRRVVAGMVDPDPRTAGSGLRRLADAGMDVSVGVEGAACQALNAPFVHRILEKACYGVLHCVLTDADPSELEHTQGEGLLVLPPDPQNYAEYDAIVVEGRAGVAKMEACAHLLPASAWRVVILGSGCGIETELECLERSSTFADFAAKTVVVVASAQGAGSGGDPPQGRIRSTLASRGVKFVDVTVPSSPGSDAVGARAQSPDASEAAVVAVASELYGLGLLCSAWDVGSEVAVRALQGGHIQRAFVRRRRRVPGDGACKEGSSADPPVRSAAEVRKSGDTTLPSTNEGDEEDRAVVRAIKRLSGNDRVCVRSRDGLPRLEPKLSREFVEVLLPVDPLREAKSKPS